MTHQLLLLYLFFQRIKDQTVEEIIIAMPSAPKTEISKIVTECQKTKCSIKILPSLYLSMNNDNKNVPIITASIIIV